MIFFKNNLRADCVCSGIFIHNPILLLDRNYHFIQYLLYLVVLVYEYMSVFAQLYLRKWGQLLYQRIMQPLEIQGPFMEEGGTPILRHSRKVPR